MKTILFILVVFLSIEMSAQNETPCADKVEFYGIDSMDRLIFTAIERFIQTENGTQEEKFYINMIFNFIMNKHFRQKRCEWDGLGVEFKLSLLDKFDKKYWRIYHLIKNMDVTAVQNKSH